MNNASVCWFHTALPSYVPVHFTQLRQVSTHMCVVCPGYCLTEFILYTPGRWDFSWFEGAHRNHNRRQRGCCGVGTGVGGRFVAVEETQAPAV